MILKGIEKDKFGVTGWERCNTSRPHERVLTDLLLPSLMAFHLHQKS